MRTNPRQVLAFICSATRWPSDVLAMIQSILQFAIIFQYNAWILHQIEKYNTKLHRLQLTDIRW